MKKNNVLLLSLLLLIFSLSSCKKEKIETPKGDYEKGIYVVNQGIFTHGDASITYFSKDLSKKTDTVFRTVNPGMALGDVAQSIGFTEDKAYIVVNNSHKIEVVERGTMKKIVTMSSDLTNPRYFQAVDNNLAYVSCWGDTSDDDDDYLAVINTKTNTVSTTINVPLGPEKITANDDYLFVAHKGAYSTNNKISVVDLITKNIIATINVGDRPNSMIIKDSYLWVMCGGEPAYTQNETAGKLYKIDLNNNFSVVQTLDFATTEHPDFLTVNENSLYYYLNGKIYKMDIADTSLPTSEVISKANVYYMQAHDGKLFVTDATYTAEGHLNVYDLSNNQAIISKTVGFYPGDLGFNF